MEETGSIARPDGATIAFTRLGDQEAKTILLCSGLGGTQEGLIDDARFFASIGYHAVTMDIRGLGDSGPPRSIDQAGFTLEKMGADAVALIDELSLAEPHFVGNSMGGLIGLEVIRQRPELLGSLTTFGTTYHLKLGHWRVSLQYLTYRLIGGKRLPEFVANKGTRFEHARPPIRAMFRKFPPDIARQMSENIYRYDYREVATNWNGPIQLIRGDQDKGINAHLKTTLAALEDKSNFRVVDLDEAGHFMNLDNPDGVRNAICEWVGPARKQDNRK